VLRDHLRHFHAIRITTTNSVEVLVIVLSDAGKKPTKRVGQQDIPSGCMMSDPTVSCEAPSP